MRTVRPLGDWPKEERKKRTAYRVSEEARQQILADLEKWKHHRAEARKYSPVAIAERLGIHPRTVDKYRYGEH